MKLVISLACLGATLALASHAMADGRTTATLQQPIAAKTQFIANGAIWDCEGSTCVAANTPDQTFGPSQCHDVARPLQRGRCAEDHDCVSLTCQRSAAARARG